MKIDQQMVEGFGRTTYSEKKINLGGTFQMYIVAQDYESLYYIL